jgi:hypothetical protein
VTPKTKTAKTAFKKRYVLAEGYPYALGTGGYVEAAMCADNTGVNLVRLDWPKELWSAKLPKYRLVLERMEAQ